MSIRIAFISYEYPPDTGGGGIGTYTWNITQLLVKSGFNVTVFCATSKTGHFYIENDIHVHRVNSWSLDEFRLRVLNSFREVHQKQPFDIIESSDYGADGFFVKKEYNDVCYVVKLHTPSFVINYYNNYHLQYILIKTPYHRFKNFISTILNKSYIEDIEYQNIIMANCILSPSKALAKKIYRSWRIDLNKIDVLPNPHFGYNVKLSELPLYSNQRVTFIGKLSILKGLIDFPEIIRVVHERLPGIHFRFIGEDSFSPISDISMKQYLLMKVTKHKENIEFIGKVNLSEIEKYLRETDIVICNSLWENYPMILLEAMSLGRIVIATKTGGIPEIITNKKNGFLVPVKSPKKIGEVIISCFNDMNKMKKIGQNAYNYFLNDISSDIMKIQIVSYYNTIYTDYVQ